MERPSQVNINCKVRSENCIILADMEETIESLHRRIARMFGVDPAMVSFRRGATNINPTTIYSTIASVPMRIGPPGELPGPRMFPIDMALDDAYEYLIERPPSSIALSEEYSGMITFKDLDFGLSLEKTIRIPQDGKRYPLPPSLGSFQAFSVAKYAKNADSVMRALGGVFVPIEQSEALWIQFSGSGEVAVKICVGGVDVVSGRSGGVGLDSSMQNYIVRPTQPWIDGIVCPSTGQSAGSSESDSASSIRSCVRQFVAVPLGYGLSIEGQLTKNESKGGIQIEVFQKKASNFRVCNKGRNLDIKQTPADNGLTLGTLVQLISEEIAGRKVSKVKDYFLEESLTVNVRSPMKEEDQNLFKLYVKTLTGKTLTVQASSEMYIEELKLKIEKLEGIEPCNQRYIFAGKQLEEGNTIGFYRIKEECTIHMVLRLRGGGTAPDRLGIGAGGNIIQEIYRDTNPGRWSKRFSTKLQIHLVNRLECEGITKQRLPKTVCTYASYVAAGYKWYDWYDPNRLAVDVANQLAGIKPTRELMENIACPVCMCAASDVNIQPCKHGICSKCLATLTAMSSNCPLCRGPLQAYSRIGPKFDFEEELEAYAELDNPTIVLCNQTSLSFADVHAIIKASLQ